MLEKYTEATDYLQVYMKWVKREPEFAYFPTVALEMLKLGKLYSYLGNLKIAKEYLEDAKQIYSKLLFVDDPLYQKCEEELYKVKLEYELLMDHR